jgi:hypothetical protein
MSSLLNPNINSLCLSSRQCQHVNATCRYPRGDEGDANSDLCTLRIDPSAEHGWLVAENRERAEALVYVWEREAFPWLMVRDGDDASATHNPHVHTPLLVLHTRIFLTHPHRGSRQALSGL